MEYKFNIEMSATINDTVAMDMVIAAIEKQTTPYELFNVGVGKAVSVKDVVNKIITHSGRDLEVVHDLSKPTIPTSLFLDCTKAKEMLAWEAKTDLDTGIIKTLNWYKENI